METRGKGKLRGMGAAAVVRYLQQLDCRRASTPSRRQRCQCITKEAGVILHLKAKRTGLMLSLGGDAVVISMRQ